MKDPSRTARAEASVWLVRLHGPHRTPELEARFRKWFTASPEKAREFERVTEVWDTGTVRSPGMPRVARDSGDTRSRRGLLAALFISTASVAGLWGASTYWLNPSYSTGIGEQRMVRLSDGSRLTLNADSGVVVSYRRNERRVRIERGEALFEVAQDPTRPFRVRAGNRQAEAVGTSLLVRREAQQLSVTLLKGRATVTGLDRPARSAWPSRAAVARPDRIVLTEGERLRYFGPRSRLQLDKPRLYAVTAWMRGEVILDRTPLAEAVEEMNRYDPRRLVIDDPGIAAIRISGVYHTGDSELFAAMVARLYGLGVLHRGGRIHLISSRKTVTAESYGARPARGVPKTT